MLIGVCMFLCMFALVANCTNVCECTSVLNTFMCIANLCLFVGFLYVCKNVLCVCVCVYVCLNELCECVHLYIYVNVCVCVCVCVWCVCIHI